MIVRDEEKRLPRCLRSIKGVWDDLVVVDTGSRDNTVSIARDYGARVFSFTWCDDFAAARNEALKHAIGDWIFQIDADEELTSAAIPDLRQALNKADVLHYLVRCDNGPRFRGPRFEWIGRLFRNNQGIRYDRPYHETVEFTVGKIVDQENGWKIRHLPSVVLRHYGYDPSDALGKQERGRAIMEAYLNKEPDDAYILTKLAGIYHGLGRYQDAGNLLERAVRLAPNWVETNYQMGLTRQEQGQASAAIGYFQKTIELDPKFAEGYACMGIVEFRRNALDKAEANFKKALSINPDLTLAHNYLGLTYKSQGKLDESIAELKRAVAIDPELAEVHVDLCAVYIYKGLI